MKALLCRDVGLDCDFVARGCTNDEVLKKATEHAVRDHGVTRISRDYIEACNEKIHNA